MPRGQTVLVTGSTGLVGSRLAAALADSYRVVGLDVKPSKGDTPKAEFVACDLTKADSVASPLQLVADQSGGRKTPA